MRVESQQDNKGQCDLTFDEREEFFPSLLLCAEAAKHTRSGGDRTRLLYATHSHA